MRRLSYLQGLRGTAAAVVLVHHYFAAFYPSAIFGAGINHGGWEHLFWSSPLGIVSSGISPVCIFFILSGFVLSLPYFGEGAKEAPQLLAAMVKRPFRLVGLVWATMFAAMILSHSGFDHSAQISSITGSRWLETQQVPPTTWAHFIKDFVTDPFGTGQIYNVSLWTITFELAGSYLTFLFILLFRNSRLRWLGYLVVGLPFYHSFYVAFLVGILLADIFRNRPALFTGTRANSVLSTILLLVGIYLASFASHLDPAYVRYSWHAWLPRSGNSYVYPMAGAVALFLSVLLSPLLQRLFSSSILVYLGRVSYALYAIHFLVIRSFSSWAFSALIASHGYHESVVLTVGASTLLILILAHVLTARFDEPVIRGANRIAEAWMKSRIGNSI